MKRLSILVVALAFVGVNAMAEDAAAPGMHFGVHAGVNFASESFGGPAGWTAPNTGSATGFLAGALLEAPITDLLGIQPELNFVQKGTKDATGTNTTKLNYIEIPVFVKAKWNFNGFKPFVGAGPSLGFLLSVSDTAGSQNLKDKAKSIDFGLQFALGAAYAVTESLDVFVDARYNLGLTNVMDGAKAYAGAANADQYTAKNKGFQITAGVMF
jgi:opacity protein-like surface antigen